MTYIEELFYQTFIREINNINVNLERIAKTLEEMQEEKKNEK